MAQITTLQIAVSTLGRDGIDRAALSLRPRIDGVEWLIIWQRPSGEIPPELIRSDIKVIPLLSKGLTRSRNVALEQASAEWMVLSDDDMDYTPRDLENMREALSAAEKSADIILFGCDLPGKTYPDKECSLAEARSKGYWASSVEIAMKPRKINQAGVRFNESFGLGSGRFPAGEEDILLFDAAKKHLNIEYRPLRLGSHRGVSSGVSRQNSADMIAAKGAVYLHIHPLTWPMRILRLRPSAWRPALCGAWKAIRLGVFSAS